MHGLIHFNSLDLAPFDAHSLRFKRPDMMPQPACANAWGTYRVSACTLNAFGRFGK